MIKVHIITQNEPFYVPKMMSYILSNNNNNYKIHSYSVLKPHRKNKSYFHWFKERAKIYTIWELFIAGLLFLYTKINYLIFRGSSFYHVKNIFKKHEIKEIHTDNINSKDYINTLKEQGIDVIISVSSPQLFGEELLSAAKCYCINAHGTLLHRHRGVFGSWWTLFCNDEEAGSTLHTMELKLDAGEILWQKSFRVESDDTQYSIARKTKRDMASGIVETLNNIANDRLEIIKSTYESSYHRAPTKEQGREFHKKGNNVIRMKDIWPIIKDKWV